MQGANGAGKTSLIRLLVGLGSAESGEVLYRQQPVGSQPDYAAELIYLGHKTGLNPHFSALENLRFYCLLEQIAAEEAFLYDLLAKLGLVGLEDLPIVHLSAGQQRRVALARLWLKPACLWVLDEPFTALDVKAIALLQEHMQQFLQGGGAILLSSHQTLEIPARRLMLDYQL